MLTFNRIRFVPALAAATVLAGLAASPAAAAVRAHHRVAPVAAAEPYEPAEMAPAPSLANTVKAEPNNDCYPTRIQVPTVGGGLRWQSEMTCSYDD